MVMKYAYMPDTQQQYPDKITGFTYEFFSDCLYFTCLFVTDVKLHVVWKSSREEEQQQQKYGQQVSDNDDSAYL